MNSIERLAEIFKQFPGIGPRQAKRFVYYLLSRHDNYAGELVKAVQELKKEITQCRECMRFYAKGSKVSDKCSICLDETRDSTMLMIVPRDIDFEAVEKSGSYNGYYFVLGGVVPILEKEPEKKIRISKLETKIKDAMKNGLKEVIIAMNANMDGENTTEYLKQTLVQGETLYSISVLGRGLSTGAELEYADPETLKNALKNRSKQ